MKVVVLGSQEMLWEAQDLVDEFLESIKATDLIQICVAIEDPSAKEAKAQIARLLESTLNDQMIVLVVEDIATTAAMILMGIHEALPEIIYNVFVMDCDGKFHSVYTLCEDLVSELLNSVTAK